jgi:hypothetical protein
VRRLELSTSELQPAALELYRHAGYRLLHEGVVEQASNKTLGDGIRRYYFEKILQDISCQPLISSKGCDFLVAPSIYSLLET